MEFFQLHHPVNATVLCDRKGCDQVADYLEVDDHGHEYRLCASHTSTNLKLHKDNHLDMIAGGPSFVCLLPFSSR